MLDLLRMILSVLFGVIGVFLLMFAIEFHLEVNEACRIRQGPEQIQDSGNNVVAPLTSDEYYVSMLGTICSRYGIAGVFLSLSAASFVLIRSGRNRAAADIAQVYGPEEK